MHTVALYYREVNNDITLFIREELMRNLSNRVLWGMHGRTGHVQVPCPSVHPPVCPSMLTCSVGLFAG